MPVIAGVIGESLFNSPWSQRQLERKDQSLVTAKELV